MENQNRGGVEKSDFQKEAEKELEKINPSGQSAEEIGEQKVSENYGKPHRIGHDSEGINEIVKEKGDYT